MMTVAELAAISGLKNCNKMKKLSEIPGVKTDKNGSFLFPDGSRYYYDAHRYKFDDMGKRRKALLDATFHNRYVDYSILCMQKESFDTMIEELLDAGLIQENGSNNPYGANKYDTTMRYEDVLLINKEKQAQVISNIVAEVAGRFMKNAF